MASDDQLCVVVLVRDEETCRWKDRSLAFCLQVRAVGGTEQSV